MRYSVTLRPAMLAFTVALAGAAAATAHPAAAPAAAEQGLPNAACAQALAYEKSAADNGAGAQARYDAAAAGLASNARCNDPQMKLVNEAYLLSMRAPAEHDLHVGDWLADMTRANALLKTCSATPGLSGTSHGNDCATQLRYNAQVTKLMTTTPSPLPKFSPAPSPRPQRT